jgi:FkbM family methyltransferase
MTLTSWAAAQFPERLLVRLVSLAYRRFEPEIRSADEVCGRGGTMVDIGGWYGPWARRLVRRASRVVVIEPTPLHEVLSRTLPSGVDVIGAAASDHDGEAEIWLPSPNGATRGVSSLHRRDIHSTSVRVPLVTVDGLGLRDVTFMKIDVDGHEIPVLRGAAETVSRDKPRLLIEVEQRIQPVENVTDLLACWGYRGWVKPGRQWVPLAGFPLAAHQARTMYAADRGLARRLLWPFPRYVNSVLFLPESEAPGSRRAREGGRGTRPGRRVTQLRIAPVVRPGGSAGGGHVLAGLFAVARRLLDHRRLRTAVAPGQRNGGDKQRHQHGQRGPAADHGPEQRPEVSGQHGSSSP